MSLKYTLSLGTMLAGMIAGATIAYADGVYLLQLGSFDEQGKAQARWESLQSKYPDMLGNLSVRLMDVTLPPDNFKVYRTQAGSLPSRAEAQAVCDRLASRGDECYVVETAMFVDGSSAKVPNPPLSVEGQQVGSTRVVPATQLSKPIAAPVEAPVSAPAPMVSPDASPIKKAADMKREAAEEEGFWSSLNPFSESKPKAQAAKADEADYPELKADAPAPMAVMAQPQAPVAMMSEPSAQVQPQLPPPPMPKAQSMQVVDQQRMMAEQHNMNRAPASPMLAPQAGMLSGGSQDVAVAEAIQVPLSEQQQAMPVQPVRVQSVAEMQSLGMPSMSAASKTLWAQVSYFPDQQSALGFWENFRAQNQSLPPLRVRITSPYMMSGGEKRVSLRVGPFAQGSHINQFCGQVPDNLRCNVVADLGASTSARYDRGALPESRYVQRQPQLSSSVHWVQLGSYGTPGEAEGEWMRISTMSRPLLDSMQPNITPPMQGSAMRSTYRLRTGPYMSRMGADQLCAQLRSRGASCVVTFGR